MRHEQQSALSRLVGVELKIEAHDKNAFKIPPDESWTYEVKVGHQEEMSFRQ